MQTTSATGPSGDTDKPKKNRKADMDVKTGSGLSMADLASSPTFPSFGGGGGSRPSYSSPKMMGYRPATESVWACFVCVFVCVKEKERESLRFFSKMDVSCFACASQ